MDSTLSFNAKTRRPLPASERGPFLLEREQLVERGRALHEAYVTATPFPHVILEEFLPPEICAAVIGEFPGVDDIVWKKHLHLHSDKLACGNETQFGPATRELIAQLNASSFVEFLEAMTGISGLIPDPHLWGGGLHCIPRGGHLGIHADFNVYERLNLDRRLNLLLYLNDGWNEEWGGHLELWNRDMTRAERRIAPIANRAVVFSTTDTAFHGHPDPLVCPPERTRRSIALYYYTSGRPADERSDAHSTLYRRRPGERLRLIRTAGSAVKRILWPILADFAGLFG